MQVKVEDLSSVKKTIYIEIPEEKITRELDRAYEDLKKKAKLKGFRPGKAPRGVLERYFKKDVHADVSSKLIQESFLDAIKENDLKIVGTPKIDPPELQTKTPYKYSAVVEVRPEIEDLNFKGFSLKKTLYRIDEKEVEGQLSILRKNLAKHEPVDEDRPLSEGDFAVIEYEGFHGDEPVPQLPKTKDYMLKVGDAVMTGAFDRGITGMKPGETRKVEVEFPEDFYNKPLANLSAAVEVTLKEIRKEVLPELDDEFAKKMGPYETMEDLKTAIRKNLTQGYDKRVEQELNEQIFQQLLSQTDFELPDTLVKYELEHIVTDAERYFSYHNVKMEDAGLTRESLAEKYRGVAEKQVKRHLIMQKVIDQAALTLTDEEKEAGFQEMSESVGQPIDQIKSYYQQNEDRLEGFDQTLLEKKAIRLILDNSEIEEAAPASGPESDNQTPENKKES